MRERRAERGWMRNGRDRYCGKCLTTLLPPPMTPIAILFFSFFLGYTFQLRKGYTQREFSCSFAFINGKMLTMPFPPLLARSYFHGTKPTHIQHNHHQPASRPTRPRGCGRGRMSRSPTQPFLHRSTLLLHGPQTRRRGNIESNPFTVFALQEEIGGRRAREGC